MSNWQKVKIGDFLFERKGRYKPNDEQISNLPRIEKIDFSGNFHIGNKDSKTDMILIKDGDLVISGINVAKGAMGIYSGEDVTATIHYSSYTFDSNKINVEYFKRFLKSSEFIELLNEQVKGGIKTEIKPKHILPLEIQLPDINTQAQIVQHFENVEDDIADVIQEVLTGQSLLKQLKQTILQEAIEGKLTVKWRAENPTISTAKELLEQIKTEKEKLVKDKKIKASKPLAPINENEIPFDIPSAWEWCRLGEIANGFQYGTSTKSKINGKVPVLRMGNIQNGRILLEELVYTDNESEIEKYSIEYNDLLFNRTNSRELVGKTAIYSFQEKVIYAGYLIKYSMILSNSHYINYVMNSIFHYKWCAKVRSDALGQSNINATKLQSYIVPLPPLEEQKEIVATIEKLFILCNELESEINQNKVTVDNLMATVLKEAFETKENIHEYKA